MSFTVLLLIFIDYTLKQGENIYVLQVLAKKWNKHEVLELFDKEKLNSDEVFKIFNRHPWLFKSSRAKVTYNYILSTLRQDTR